MLDVVLNSLRNKRTKDKIELNKNFQYQIFMTRDCLQKCKEMKTTDKRIQLDLKNGCLEFEGARIIIAKPEEGDRSLFRIIRID